MMDLRSGGRREAGSVSAVRSAGGALDAMLVASGMAEVWIEPSAKEWDLAGPKVVLEEAGGRFTDWDDNPTIDRPDALATNGMIHAEVLTILRGK